MISSPVQCHQYDNLVSCPISSMNKITHDSIYLFLQDRIMSPCKEKSHIYFGIVCMKSFIYILFCLLCCFFFFITHCIVHYQAGIGATVLVIKRVTHVMDKTNRVIVTLINRNSHCDY